MVTKIVIENFQFEWRLWKCKVSQMLRRYTNRDAPFLLLTVLGNFISSYVFACWKLAPIALDSAYENTSV